MGPPTGFSFPYTAWGSPKGTGSVGKLQGQEPGGRVTSVDGQDLDDGVREHRRRNALYSLGLLDSPPEESFDRITRLARQVIGVPIALVSLVDVDRQWSQSRPGFHVAEIPRWQSFCSQAIEEGHDVLVVPDALLDDRFAANDLVTQEPYIRFLAGAPVWASDGAMVGTLWVVDHVPRTLEPAQVAALRDLAGLVGREVNGRIVATVDDLTGLVNRRGFEFAGRRLLAYADRTRLDAALLYADSDGLKGLNDRWGHATGDAALRLVADQLLYALRDADVVARIGGDEFAALLVGANCQGAAIAADRFAARLRANPLALPDGTRTECSATIGIARRPPGGLGLAELTSQADQAMYEAKVEDQGGRSGRPRAGRTGRYLKLRLTS